MNNYFDDKVSSGQEPREEPDGPEKDGEQKAYSEPSYTPDNIKRTTQELMKYGLLEVERKPQLYRAALAHQNEINHILSPLDLRVKIDDIRGLAFLVVADELFTSENSGGDEWSHPLIRRQRLTLEQTLLAAILRQHYVAHEQEAGIGAENAVLDIEELKAPLFTYLGESGSDSRDENRLRKLLEQLHSHGIVSEIDNKSQITIRPIITHLANPETLQLLLEQFKKMAGPEKEGANNDG